MKKVLKKIYLSIMLFMVFISNSFIVYADSGLDSNYESTTSAGDVIASTLSSLLSIVGELLSSQPGDKDYLTCHIILCIICLIVIYTFTCLYIFKLDRKKKQKTYVKLLLSLIPVVLFSLLFFLTKLQLASYIFLTTVYTTVFVGVIKSRIRRKLKKQLKKVKKIDTDFKEKEFGKEAFNIYNEIQLAWIDTNIDKIKDLISKEIYNQYKDKLKELKDNNQKNIMDKIKCKSSKVVDIRIEDNIEIIECELSVTCYDYIIDKDEKVIKGKKDKNYNYVYELVFNKDLKTNKNVLVEKKVLKIK